MTGLTKIIDGILEEADREASEITQEAQGRAARILDEARQAAANRLEEAERAQKDAEEKEKKQTESAVEAKRRMVMLAEKQTVLRDSLQKAYDALKKMPLEEYTEYLKSLIHAHLRPGEGILYLSQRDRDRLPDAFLESVKKEAAKKGCTLTVSPEAKTMDGGCLLSFGGIEENCSFEALFAAKQNRLIDMGNALLFGE